MRIMRNFSFAESSLPVKILLVAGGILAGLALAALFGFIVMWLWNWLMPEIFGLPAIDFWKAWGLVLLSELLLKRSASAPSGSSKDAKRKRELRVRMGGDDACCREAPQDAPRGEAAESE